AAAATFLPVFYPQRTRFSAPQYLKLDKQVLASASGRYVHEVKSPFKNAAVLSDSYRSHLSQPLIASMTNPKVCFDLVESPSSFVKVRRHYYLAKQVVVERWQRSRSEQAQENNCGGRLW
ncbi:hypothetical protein Goshw_021076, partial [Gossypium schwendimanii]|nr:hypothetical protein [Gossypium schwendimanii]